jgi:hypothetical protein
MTASRSGSPLGSPFSAKTSRFCDDDITSLPSLGDVIHMPGSGDPEDNLDFLVKMSSGALQALLKSDTRRMCEREWSSRGGADGTVQCALCDASPVSERLSYPHCVQKGCPGCNYCGLDFYTKTTGAGRTLTLCENCFGGEWTRFGRSVFEVVRLFRLFLIDSAESIVWKSCREDLMKRSLARGLAMFRRQLWCALEHGPGSLVEVDTGLHTRVLEKAIEVEFLGAHGRRLLEVTSGDVKKFPAGAPFLS